MNSAPTASSTTETLWDLADQATKDAFNLPRPKRGSTALSYTCLGISVVAAVVMGISVVLMFSDPSNALVPWVTYTSEVVAMLGGILFVQLGPLQVQRAFVVAGKWAGRIGRAVLVTTVLLVTALVVAGIVQVLIEHRPEEFPLLLGVQALPLALSFVGLSQSPAVIRTQAVNDPVSARAWTIIVWALSCLVFAIAMTLTAHWISPTGVGTVTVVLTVAATIIAAATALARTSLQRSRELENALTGLFLALGDPSTEQGAIVAAALQLESTVIRQEQASGWLLHPFPLSAGVRAVLFYALQEVTGIPFREVSTTNATYLAERIAPANLRLRLTEYVWVLRIRTLRPPLTVRAHQKPRFDPPPPHDSCADPAEEAFGAGLDDVAYIQ